MRTASRGGWTGSISGRSRFPPRTATRQQEPACTSTSSTPASGRSTPSSGAGRTTCMTSSVWPARTVTGTAHTWRASSVQRRTGSPRESSLHGLRVVFDCSGVGYTTDVIAGVDWVAAHHASPAVANMSLGAGDPDSALTTAVTNLWKSGVFVAVAAGNHNADARQVLPLGART